MKLTDKFTFGKHKGETLEEILRTDAQYILWAKIKGLVTIDKEAEPLANMCIQHIGATNNFQLDEDMVGEETENFM